MQPINHTFKNAPVRTHPGWLVAIGILMTGTAFAGPFDGNWIGQIPPSGQCRAVATMTITVSGDTLSGAVHNPGNVAPLKGSIGADGNATFTTV